MRARGFTYPATLQLYFFTFFLRPAEIPVDKLSEMPALKWLNVRSNPLDSKSLSALQSPHHFDILTTQS